ncbi:MAG: flagellar hook-length control protein FliK [Caulobacterales bacterium]|nr:flagellar hook-length control protein FliK [Caulobacterales bacterium]MCA0371288.1 flagellar hook-length control protein FliK [Pseudomonadota bacterium]
MKINDFKGEPLPQVSAVKNVKAKSDDFAKLQSMDNFARLVETPSNDVNYKEVSIHKIDEKPQEVSKDKDIEASKDEESDKSEDKAKPENGIILALIFPNQTQNTQAINSGTNTKSANGEIAVDVNGQNANANPAQNAQTETNTNAVNIKGQVLTGENAQKFEAALKKIGNAQTQETDANGKTNKQATNNISQTTAVEKSTEAKDITPKTNSIEFDGQKNSDANIANVDGLLNSDEKEAINQKDDKLANNIETLKQGPKAENFEKWASEVSEKSDPKLQLNNLHTIAATMVKKFQNGDKKFFVRLDPPELGKIEVELKISSDNKVSAILKTENPQALNELMKGARDLVNSLNQAGFDLTENDLSFSLNSNGNQSGNSQNQEAQEKSNGKIINLQNQKEEIQPEIANTKSKTIRHEIWDRARVSMVI